MKFFIKKFCLELRDVKILHQMMLHDFSDFNIKTYFYKHILLLFSYHTSFLCIVLIKTTKFEFIISLN